MTFQKYANCIEACDACAAACNHCAASCLKEDNVSDMTKCIELDMDCAELCRLASAFMARNSPFALDLCRLCAQVCDKCAEVCARHDHDHCQDCARACKRCADECRLMLVP